MHYDIRLVIGYDYSRPVEAGRHVLCLTPPGGAAGQSVGACRLTVVPRPDEWLNRQDFFGNDMVEIAFRDAVSHMRFEMDARVERLPAPSPPGAPAALADIAGELSAVRDLGPLSPHHFIAPSARAAPDEAIAAFARDVTGHCASASAAVIALGEALHRTMAYDPEATAVDTPAAGAFALRRGVCQDFSHIMIIALRSLGIPAGYVSGFLRTNPPPGQPRLEGADAMHAWVRAWCGREAGFVEYDPTNATSAGEDHITVAVGRDYADVAPVRGVMRSAGWQVTRQSVDVRPVTDID
ncbi:transglutaminase-like putative cysteine protease [Pseudochelatococcus lubricantis]|uniref:Transglutaminase-like putative cysteine protease n=1 Tax=Pseudochelatococcus lubricantis TaxID=1538102 RepID=A0ABX0V593_9HYPH|nr:transglutaminase family protein [Pseudochelatococcus lubricantis]NIJ58281.1 transglutaminase-like putative cysteine protease [Pseudochelatococcus lubricantis]